MEASAAAVETDSSPATSEVSDDSEAGSLFSALSFAAADDDADDAESCSGGGGGRGWVYSDEEEDERDGGRSEQCRWMSWRSWLMEKCEVGGRRDDAAAEEDEMAVEETDQSNRRFWETCLADGY